MRTVATAVIALAGLGLAAIVPAQAAPTLVTTCGTTIVTSGLYEVTSDLQASGTGPCISINAPNVTLGIAANITGIHAGIGIHILKSGAVVRGDGNGRTISNFSIGVSDDSGGSVIGDFDVTGNGTGLYLRGAVNIATTITDVKADNNSMDGIRITSPAGVRGAQFEANDNGRHGVLIDKTADKSMLAHFSAKNNGTSNVDIAGSSTNIASCNVSDGKYGVVVENGAGGNAIVGCDHNGGKAPAALEAYDKNATCGTNLWFGNSFSYRHKPDCTNVKVVGTAITKCGTINQSGAYHLTKNLTATGNCLIVTAKNVTFDMNGFGLTGAGTGIGMHVTKTASNFRALGDDFFANNFATGLEVEAAGAVIEGPGFSGDKTGVLIQGADGVSLGNFSANGNTTNGLYIRESTHTFVHNFGANSNGKYGVFLQQSSNNTLAQFTAGNSGANGIAGFYMGCSLSGPSASCASYISQRNVVTKATGALNTKYGWVVDAGSTHNVLIDINAGGNGTFDMYEGNATNCGYNQWVFDALGTSNMSSCKQ